MDRILSMYATSDSYMWDDNCAVCSSGGISLKPSSGMDAMRADMGGAATICSAIVTAAALNLPLNIIGKSYLCKNPKILILQDFFMTKSFSGISTGNSLEEMPWILADIFVSASLPFLLAYQKLLVLLE